MSIISPHLRLPYVFFILLGTVPAVNIDGGRQAPHYKTAPIAPAQYQVRPGNN